MNKNIASQWIDGTFPRLTMGEEVADGCVYPCVCRAGRNGMLYVADELGHALLALDARGKLVKTIGGKGEPPGKFHYPTDIAISPDGELLVTDRWNHCIQVFDEDSLEFKKTIGGRGRGSGEFLEPWGVVFFKDNIIVSERENERLSILDGEARFLAHRHELFGYDFPLGCVSALAVVGRFLILLMNAFEILVIDEWFHVENTIRLPNDVGPVTALYPLGPDTFAAATDTATLAFYSLDGTRIATRNVDLTSSDDKTQTPGEDDVVCLITDIEKKSFGLVYLPSMTHPFVNEAEKQQEQNRLEPPATFRFSCFLKTLDSFSDSPDERGRLLSSYITFFPAVASFYDTLHAHPGIPDGLKNAAAATALRLVRRTPLNHETMHDRHLSNLIPHPRDGFYILLNPSGLAHIGENGLNVISRQFPEFGRTGFCLADGSLIVSTMYREIHHCNPETGESKAILTSTFRERRIPMYPVCRIDDHTFYFLNAAKKEIEVYDAGKPGAPVGRAPRTPKAPQYFDYNPRARRLYILDEDYMVHTLDPDADAQPIPRFSVAMPGPEWFVYNFNFAGDDLLVFYIAFVRPEKRIVHIVGMHHETGDIRFRMDAYTMGRGPLKDVRTLRGMSPVFAGADSGFYIMDRFERELLKFDTVKNTEGAHIKSADAG